MYKLCVLLCALSTAASEDSKGAKYIDLLPESEKQEFLNRIARRILEEIQGRDSPEQPHAEITDDQLDAHNAYVQDLIKQETEVHKNERRDVSIKEAEEPEDNKGDQINDTMKDQLSAKNDANGNSENRDDIDLTRKDRRFYDSKSRETQNQDKNDDSTLGVIPVKVIYGEEDDSVEALKNKSVTSSFNKDMVSSNGNEQKNNLFDSSSHQGQYISKKDENKVHILNNNKEYKNNLNSDGDEISIENNTSSYKLTNVPSFGTEKVTEKTSIGKEVTDTDNIRDMDRLNYQTNNDKDVNHKLGTLVTVMPEEADTKENTTNYDVFRNINSASNNNINSDDRSPVPPKSAKDDNLIVGLTTALPDVSVQSISATVSKVLKTSKRRPSTANVPKDRAVKKNTVKEVNSSVIYFNTVEKRKSINDKNREQKDAKKYIRKTLQISEEYARNIEKRESGESNENFNSQPAENKKVKQYIVYEVSKDKPSFIKESSSPIVESQEDNQPQYIPIYNFAPNNVYYNPYNRFGPSNDDDIKAIERSSLNNNDDVLDRDLYKHGAFYIDLKPTSRTRVSLKNKNRQYLPQKHLLTKSDQSADKINDLAQTKTHKIMYEPNFDMDYYYNIDALRQNNDNYASAENFLRTGSSNQVDSKDSQRFDMDYYFDDMRRNDLRHRKKGKKYHVRQGHLKPNYKGKVLPNSNEKDHPLHSMFKDNINHMRAVKKMLYRQKQFGFLSPSARIPDMTPRRKTIFDEDSRLVNSDFKAMKIRNDSFKKSDLKDIAKDYYWGRVLDFNTQKDMDFDDVFMDSKDVKKTKEGRLIRESENPDGYDFETLDPLLNVIRDMIQRDNRDLVSYDWLMSTVDVESALKKLLDLTENAENGNYIHPLDLKLLNFVIYLYDSSSKTLIKNKKLRENDLQARQNTNDVLKNLMNILRLTLPKNKHRKPGEKIKNPLNLWRTWYKYYIRVLNDENNKNAIVIQSFKNFLKALQENLYDLHNTIKQIALITTLTDQNWYHDLKRIFFKSATRRQLLQVLLHLSTSKLYKSIESSAKKTEGDYSNYVMNNSEEIRRLKEEFVMVLRVLDKLVYGNLLKRQPR